MKILIVSQFYYPERFSVDQVASQLVSLGHEVQVITGVPNYGFGRKLKEYKHVHDEVIDGVKVHRVNLFARKKTHLSVYLNYLSFWKNAKRYVGKIKEKFDVVLSFSLSPVISIAPAIKYAKKWNVPHVLMCEDLWPESTVVTGAVRKNSLTYKILYKWSVSLYKNCDKILISSPSFEEYFKNELKINDKKFVYINQPILKSQKKLEPVVFSSKYNIVYAGNIGKLQLTDKLLDAMKLLKDVDVTLHLSGMGSELDHILKRIREEDLIDKVKYNGALPIEKCERYFFNADALIVALKSGGVVGKTIPNKAIQYMSYGKPILGIISGDGKDLLAKAKGTIFSSEDPKEIAKAIKEICYLEEKEKVRLGTNNKNYFETNLTTEKLTYLLSEELIDSIK